MADPARVFRTSPERPMWANAARTVVQVAGMWGLFLFALPWALLQFEDWAGLVRLDTGPLRTVAVFVFWTAGLSGLTCGWSFVRWGRGTPFPCDQATQLTIVGLYRHVRNPMAMLGIAQGLAVALYLGSWTVGAYALMGALVWEVFARPPEERDLERRFGEQYEEYRRSVRCWVPRLRPYRRVVAEPRAERGITEQA